MKRINSAVDRIVFGGRIPPGTGDHDYLCAKCAAPVLEQVGVRQPSSAVYECIDCGALNVVAATITVSDEVRERMTTWFGPTCDRFTKERRKTSRDAP